MSSQLSQLRGIYIFFAQIIRINFHKGPGCLDSSICQEFTVGKMNLQDEFMSNIESIIVAYWHIVAFIEYPHHFGDSREPRYPDDLPRC